MRWPWLSRYGNNVFKYLCDLNGVQLVFLDEQNSEKTYEEEMVQDLMSIVHVYSCRLYGKRGTDAVLKTVSDETKQSIIQLKAEGRSIEGIARVLNQEGFSYDNDEKTPISRHVVKEG
jgi:hypothetical protein